MNKYTLSAISLAMLSAHATMADVAVYGKVDVSLQSLKEKVLDGEVVSQDNYELLSNKSRLGVKGEEAINKNLKAIYQMEMEVSLDSGDTGGGQTFKQRNTFVGLGGGWGTALAGIHDTPTKMLNKQIDLFNDMKYGDLDNSTVGENRQKNMVMYRSPVMSGINFDVMVTPGEDKGSEAINNAPGALAKDKRNEGANGVSSAVTYTNGGFKAGFGVDSKIQSKMEIGTAAQSRFGYDSETDLQRLVLSYDSAAFGVAGMFQNAKQSSGDVNSATLDLTGFTPAPTPPVASFGKAGDVESFHTAALGGYYNINSQWKLKALAVQTSFKEAEVKFSQMDVGVDYKLAKNTMLFGYVGNVSADADSIDKQIGDNTTVGFGIDHVFGL